MSDYKIALQEQIQCTVYRCQAYVYVFVNIFVQSLSAEKSVLRIYLLHNQHSLRGLTHFFLPQKFFELLYGTAFFFVYVFHLSQKTATNGFRSSTAAILALAVCLAPAESINCREISTIFSSFRYILSRLLSVTSAM